MNQLAAIEDLRRAAAVLAESGDVAGERVAERLRYYLEEAPCGLAIEVALEIPVGP